VTGTELPVVLAVRDISPHAASASNETPTNGSLIFSIFIFISFFKMNFVPAPAPVLARRRICQLPDTADVGSESRSMQVSCQMERASFPVHIALPYGT
jgi:hypothetical protein